MTGSKGTRTGIRVTQAYTVAAVSAFFDRRRRRVTCLITLNYPRLRCLRLLVGPWLQVDEQRQTASVCHFSSCGRTKVANWAVFRPQGRKITPSQVIHTLRLLMWPTATQVI